MKNDVFISYSRADLEEVKALVQNIQSQLPSLKIWFDLNGIESGDEFDDKLVSAIDDSSTVLFALSDNSLSSKYAKDEIIYAKNTNKRVIPVLLRGAQLKGWFLFKFGRIDFIDSTNIEHMNKLIKNLGNMSNNMPPYSILGKNPKVQDFLFIVDCSGKMYGDMMDSVNSSLNYVMHTFKVDDPSVETRFNVLKIDSNPAWLFDMPKSIEQDNKIELKVDFGETNKMGDAMDLLKRTIERYSTGEMTDCRRYLPVIFVFLLGYKPSNDFGLAALNLFSNRIFEKGQKFLTCIGTEHYDSLTLYGFPCFDELEEIFFEKYSLDEVIVERILEECSLDEMPSFIMRLLEIGSFTGSGLALRNYRKDKYEW